MTFSEVKDLLLELVTRYHPGAMVVWSKTKGVTPKPPYITLGYSNLNRSAFRLDDEEKEHRYYNYDFTFEINLYTVGRHVTAENVSYYENTAVEDLEEFIRFLDSDEITDELAEKDVTIVMNPPVRDLSELIGDTKFNYRSMCEFTVSYVGLADGRYGVSNGQTVPNPSGGGSEEFTNAESFVVEEVIIQEESNDGN